MEALTLNEIQFKRAYNKVVRTINTSYRKEHFLICHKLIDNYVRLYGTDDNTLVSKNIILDRSFTLREILNIRREVLED